MQSKHARHPEWDPLSLTYAVDGEEVELPLRLLVLGCFSKGRPLQGRSVPQPIAKDGIDQVMREVSPAIGLTVTDRLVDSRQSRDIDLEFQAIADFEPERIAQAVPVLSAVHALVEQLRNGCVGGNQESDSDALLRELGLPDVDSESAEIWRDYAIAELNDRMGRQIDEIIHHPMFQELEANWRSVELVLGDLDDNKQCRIDLLDISRDELLEDFRTAADAQDALLYQTVYAREFGQYGGQPYAAIIGSYEIGPSSTDVELLSYIARVCSYAHAPLIAAAAPAFFGLERFDELADATAITELRRAPRLAKWWSFVETDVARYIALTLPRILLRRPHAPDGDREQRFHYRENVTHDHAHGLWGSAAFAYAGCLLRSFRQFRVCVDIVGARGGRVHGLTNPVDEEPAHEAGPENRVEILLSEQKEAELAELGLIPLTVARAHQYAVFNSAHSVHWAAVESVAKRHNDPETLGLRLGAQLPYLFLISRVAHYLKVIQRDMVGTLRTEAEMETELDSWLRRYVSDVENPASKLRARRPLRMARLSVVDEEGEGNAYRMHLDLVPHTRFMSSEFALSLESRLGKN